MFFAVTPCQPDHHKHQDQDFYKAQAGEEGKLQAIFDQGHQLGHRLENRPEEKNIFCQVERDGIHDTDEEQEGHFVEGHTICPAV
jgi:hypothetical protein